MTRSFGLGITFVKPIVVRIAVLVAVVAGACAGIAQQSHESGALSSNRWRLNPTTRVITWDVANDARLPHWDSIEMGGKRTAAILKHDPWIARDNPRSKRVEETINERDGIAVLVDHRKVSCIVAIADLPGRRCIECFIRID